MKAERWRRLQELFHVAVELDGQERARFLDSACVGDPSLRRQVESLILSSEQSPGMIEDVVQRAASRIAVDDDSLTTGQQLGAYRLIEELGRGGMGAVYLAERADDQYRQRVAIKVVRGGLGAPELLQRLRRERQILANLDHPNIARLLDGGATASGAPYLVLEYVEGEPIDDYCDHHRLTLVERLQLFRTVCSAIEHAHRNLVVHRDLKPSNILVTADGVPKLLDFGIAKLLDPRDLQSTVTSMRLMTPQYASPEQVRGEAITTASDVYTLGLLLYELLTGHRPHRFASTRPKEIERVVCEREPERPSAVVTRAVEELVRDARSHTRVTPETVSTARGSEPQRLRKDLSGDLDDIVMMALRKEPARRYASVDLLSEDIRRHLAGLPVLARANTLGYRAQKFIKRHRWGVVAGAAFVLLISLLISFYTVRLTRERNTARLEAQKASQVSAFLVDLFALSDPAHAKGETITARELLETGARRIRQQLAGQPEVRATMLHTMGEVYRSLGLYSSATPLLEEALQIRRSVHGGRDLATAETKNLLGLVRQELGDYEAAGRLYAGALEVRRALLGETHEDVLATRLNQGSLAVMEGKYDEAERLFRQVLATARNALGDEHLVVADSLNSLAGALQEKGNYAAAEPLRRRVVALRQKLLDDGDPRIGSAYNNLGHLLALRGDYRAAAEAHRQAQALWRRVLGDQHPRVATSLNNLASVLKELGEFSAAERLQQEALEIYRQTLGQEHPQVAMSLNNLANLKHDQGDLGAAEKLHRQALILNRKIFGDQHPSVATSLHNLGSLLHERGDLPAAESFYRQALELDRKSLGDEHPWVAGDLSTLASLLVDRGDYDAAEPLLRQALALQRRVHHEEHPNIATTLQELGRLLVETSRPQEASVLLREALRIREQALPEAHWALDLTRSLLGASLAALGDVEEGLPLLEQGYAGLQEKRGEGNRYTAQARERLAHWSGTGGG